MPLCATAVAQQAFPLHCVRGHFWSLIPKSRHFDSVSCWCPTPSQHNPPNHRRCCSFKAPAEQQQLLGLQLNSTSHEMRDSKKSTEREKAEASETIRHLKAVWDSRRGKKEKESLTVLSRGAQRGLCCSFTRCCSTDTLQTWAHLHLRSTFQCLKLLILLNSQTPNEPHPKGSCQAILAHLTD